MHAEAGACGADGGCGACFIGRWTAGAADQGGANEASRRRDAVPVTNEVTRLRFTGGGDHQATGLASRSIPSATIECGADWS